MFRDFASGLRYVGKGFTLIKQPGIRPFVVIPFVINVLIFALAVWFAGAKFSELMDWMLPQFTGWLVWLNVLRYLLWPLFAIVLLILIFYSFTIVANLIGSPFNAVLAARLEARLSGIEPNTQGGLATALGGIKNALGSELKKIAYLVFWMIPLIIVSFIPVINFISPVLWAVFGAWMLALEYTDYPMGNHDMYFAEERALLRRHKPLALGFGGGIMLMTMIPVLNFFAMPVGVAGATALWVERLSAARETARED